jgi:hypothetical protein
LFARERKAEQCKFDRWRGVSVVIAKNQRAGEIGSKQPQKREVASGFDPRVRGEVSTERPFGQQVHKVRMDASLGRTNAVAIQTSDRVAERFETENRRIRVVAVRVIERNDVDIAATLVIVATRKPCGETSS